MPDATFIEPDLTLLLGPNDTAIRVGECPPGAGARREAGGSLHVVVHRNHGDWTHVYRVQQNERADRLQVHLLKVFEGERIAEARGWALAGLAGSPTA